MTIEEIFNKQKAILLELGFPINPNAKLIVFNSVYRRYCKSKLVINNVYELV